MLSLVSDNCSHCCLLKGCWPHWDRAQPAQAWLWPLWLLGTSSVSTGRWEGLGWFPPAKGAVQPEGEGGRGHTQKECLSSQQSTASSELASPFMLQHCPPPRPRQSPAPSPPSSRPTACSLVSSLPVLAECPSAFSAEHPVREPRARLQSSSSPQGTVRWPLPVKHLCPQPGCLL